MADLTPGALHGFTITQEEIDAYAALSGANDPIHVDVDGARQGSFGSTIAQGLLVLGRAVAITMETLEATKSGVLLEVDVAFVAPVRPGDRLSIRLGAWSAPPLRTPMDVERLASSADGEPSHVIRGTVRMHRQKDTE